MIFNNEWLDLPNLEFFILGKCSFRYSLSTQIESIGW